MAVTGLSPSEKQFYVLDRDPGKADTLEECQQNGATIFYFSSIANAIIVDMTDAMSATKLLEGGEGQSYTLRTNQRNRDAFRYGITGWDNLFDNKGNAILFTTETTMRGGKPYQVVSEEAINSIFSRDVQEIGGHIYGKNVMEDEDRKKFEASWSAFGGLGVGSAAPAPTGNVSNEDATDPPSSPPTAKQKSQSGRTRPPKKTNTAAPDA